MIRLLDYVYVYKKTIEVLGQGVNRSGVPVGGAKGAFAPSHGRIIICTLIESVV